jgi:diadenosine tetraphosphatase ApaH/serine/threonine PP2A family protein phosphatase
MHGNWEALDVVLRRMRRKHFDATLVLGDLVGYGAAPNQVVDAISALSGVVWTVRGNHDKVVSGIDSGANFNQTALAAARWTTDRLTPKNRTAVRDLPKGPRRITDSIAICHGSPLDEDAYLFSDRDAYEVFSRFDAPVTFFGHTHVTSIFSFEGRGIGVRALKGESGVLQLSPTGRYLVNPGSIGQPRDGDPRASFMTYDSEKRIVRWFRLPYPIAKAQGRILKAGLPKLLADRLGVGV